MQKTYMHTGVPVPAKMDGMNYMDSLKVWIGYNKDYDIEYLYWEKDTPAAYRIVFGLLNFAGKRIFFSALFAVLADRLERGTLFGV